MNSEPTSEALAGTLNGDLRAFVSLSCCPHTSLERCAQSLPRLILTRDGVRNVLLAFQRSEIPAEVVNTWAWFMRAGYVPGGSGPIRPLEIDYDPTAEAPIVEIVARLSELGDLIDGEISPQELDEMILSVSA